MSRFAARFPEMEIDTTAACLRLLKVASTLLRELEHHFSSHGLSQARFLALVVLEREPANGTPEVRCALRLLALTFTRPGELRFAAWKEFDLNAGVWTIPANRMKMRRPHRIPLAPQTIAILKELRTLTGRYELLFPGVRSPSRPLSENTLNAALRRLGYAKDEMSSHGFRAAASSLLNECGKWNADAIEAQLAHVEANAVRKAYARAEYWEERVKMMAYWADRLDELRRGGVVVPLRA